MTAELFKSQSLFFVVLSRSPSYMINYLPRNCHSLPGGGFVHVSSVVPVCRFTCGCSPDLPLAFCLVFYDAYLIAAVCRNKKENKNKQ